MNLYKDQHDEFDGSKMIDISHKSTEGLDTVTPLKLKDKFRQCTTQLNIVVSKSENSGQGTEPRRSYLGTSKPYILYLWSYSETFGMLDSVKQIFKDDFQIDEGQVPSVKENKVNQKRKKQSAQEKEREEDRDIMKKLKHQMEVTNENLHANNLEMMRNSLVELKRDLRKAEDELDEAEESNKPNRIKRKNEHVLDLKQQVKDQEERIEKYKNQQE